MNQYFIIGIVLFFIVLSIICQIMLAKRLMVGLYSHGRKKNMKVCPNCNSGAADEARFCNNCGNKL